MTALAEILTPAPRPNTDWRASLRRGYAVLFLSVGIGGSWAAFAHIDSAVVANGTFAVESYRKTLQHLEGGIVAEILVRDGDRVAAGQTLIRLDTTRIEASAAAAAKSLAGVLTTQARYTAQRDMIDYMVVPEEAATLIRSYGTDEIEDNHREFESRRQVMLGAIELVETQQAQARNEIAQTRLDAKSASEQLRSVSKELASVKPLLSRGLVAMSRVTGLERQKMLFESAAAKAANDARKGENKIAELDLRKEAVRKDYRQEASNALVEVAKQVAQFRGERQVALDMLTRTDIRSPVAGTVQQMRVFTVGGVIRPGEPILDIVPDSDDMVVKAKIHPSDIDRVAEGMAVTIRLNALMKYRREAIEGTLRFVSRDAILEAGSGAAPYYAVEVTVSGASVPEDIRGKLVAGMEASVIVPTKSRTVLQYVTAPVLENLEESLRER
ncbi:HlyD family type I secretion periplasmic adaptor subunit [Aureimonas leprariae]|uniref:Membrane fusion protein (MFP) family protein n=1 Tax=Plantimonas leprariae TaxID=2615207 RepID=A0A7V7PNF6_9HYPH|nr:HlyD family type I secretion periplasmic adaptor subunit [Aureimonas leprariae]KAB0679040.1 HlyD family type I secretion periplasmic adaptor subunit [Aureimonas leprariae]